MYHFLIVVEGEDEYYNVKRRLDRYFSGYSDDATVIRSRIRHKQKGVGEMILIDKYVVGQVDLCMELEKREIPYNLYTVEVDSSRTEVFGYLESKGVIS